MSVTYKICRALRFCTLQKRPKTAAVILAAGSGSRMNSEQTKQMMILRGMPLFMHSVLEFDRCEYIDEIVIVCRRDELAKINDIVSRYEVRKLSAVTVGGSTRQLSALAGFEKISSKCKYVAIHDAARACITSAMISDVVSAAYAYGAASAAGAVVDTVKRVGSSGFIKETLDRDSLMCAQTPQVFKCELYRAALYTAMKKNIQATDDNMLVERLGHRIKAVDCSRENLKVTTETDLSIAERILAHREEKESG